MQTVPTQSPEAGTGEFRRGWTVLLASLMGIGFGLTAIPFYTAGIFAPHLAKAFGWSLGEIMAGLTITTIAVIPAAPIAGVLAERYGTRGVAICSQVLFGLTFMSLAITGPSLVQFYVTWALIAALGAGTLPITWTRTVNRWFDKHRGLALGCAMMGTGLFGIISKPLLAWIIGDYGWRAGFFTLGLLPLAFALPLTLLFFREPHVALSADDSEPAPAQPTTGYTRGEAMRQWRFWLMIVVLVTISFALSGAVPNLEPILTEKGLAPETILRLTPLIGLSAIVGRIVGGLLLDRFWAPAVAFVMLGMPALSCMILAGDHLDPTVAGAGIFLLGFALGIEYDVIAYLTSRYFGMRAYAAIYAIFYVCFATGAGFAPLAFGMIHDAYGSFEPVLLAMAGLLPLAAGAFLLLGRYPRLT